MELFGRVALAALILIVIFSSAIIIYKYTLGKPGTLNAEQAGQAVLNDLQLSYPNSTVTIINTSKENSSSSSWNIFVSLVYNATSPCPTVYLEEYTYPAFNFVPTIANLYTKDCIIYGLSQTKLPYYTYLITSPEIAIAKSYNASFPSVLRYVQEYGYQNVKVHAVHYSLLGNIPFTNETFKNVWLINYTAAGASSSQLLIMNATGSILYNYTN
jgi:hypothetical protein